ncbi:MAG: glycogen/starch synthase [bacterium]|nr:glycogen/starch synthase [bacterium]
MNKNLKVLLVASECAPVIKSGELGDAVSGISKELQELGIDARVILPLYKAIEVKKHNLKPIWREKRLKVKKNTFSVGLWSGILPESSTPIYLVENKKYLGSGDSYLTKKAIAGLTIKNSGVKTNHKKEIERYAFFSDVVFTLLKEKLLPFEPDIVHAHDWQTGSLVAQLANYKLQVAKQIKKDRKRKKTNGLKGVNVMQAKSEIMPPKVMFTVHNLADQGMGNGKNYLREGIENTDLITTSSSTYAQEIQSKEHGFGLHALLRRKQPRGILHGFNYENLDSFEDKDEHKLKFQEEHNLKQGNSHPIFAMVSALHEHKGIQWVLPVVSYMVEMYDAQFVFSGTGEKHFEEALLSLTKRYPQNIFVQIGSDEKLDGAIYAASDFILMPSSHEPFGSKQMIAMSYGSLPIARATGGLRDSIEDGKTGFLFEEKNEKALLKTMQRALAVFVDEESLGRMRELALEKDFSWEKPIIQYAKLYRELMTRQDA